MPTLAGDLRAAAARAAEVERQAARVPELEARVRDLEEQVQALQLQVQQQPTPGSVSLAALTGSTSSTGSAPSSGPKRVRPPSSDAGSSSVGEARALAKAHLLGPISPSFDVGHVAHEVQKRIDTLRRPEHGKGSATDGWSHVKPQSMAPLIHFLALHALPGPRPLLFIGCGDCFESIVIALTTTIQLEMKCYELMSSDLDVARDLLAVLGAEPLGHDSFRLYRTTLRLFNQDARELHVRGKLVYSTIPDASVVAPLAEMAWANTAPLVMLSREADKVSREKTVIGTLDVKLAGSGETVKLVKMTVP